MGRVSSIPNISKSDNNPKRNQNYFTSKTKSKEMTAIDSLEYKKVLNTVLEGKSATKDVNIFKSLVEKAEAKLTSKLTIAPVKENSYKRESTIMMANNGLAAKARVERKTIDEISAIVTKKKTISSYTTSYEQYKRELEYVNPSYKSFGDTSKDSRGYKNNYSNYAKPKKVTIFAEIENDKSSLGSGEKVSFWTKFKNAIKNFFKTDEEKQENTIIASVQPKLDKAAQYRRSIQKAAPQINKEEVERKRIQNIREMAIKSR